MEELDRALLGQGNHYLTVIELEEERVLLLYKKDGIFYMHLEPTNERVEYTRFFYLF